MPIALVVSAVLFEDVVMVTDLSGLFAIDVRLGGVFPPGPSLLLVSSGCKLKGIVYIFFILNRLFNVRLNLSIYEFPEINQTKQVVYK